MVYSGTGALRSIMCLDVTYQLQLVREIFRDDITKLLNHGSDFRSSAIRLFHTFSCESIQFLIGSLHNLDQVIKLVVMSKSIVVIWASWGSIGVK